MVILNFSFWKTLRSGSTYCIFRYDKLVTMSVSAEMRRSKHQEELTRKVVQRACLRAQECIKTPTSKLMFLSSHPFKCSAGKSFLKFLLWTELHGDWQGDHGELIVGFHKDGKENTSMKESISQKGGEPTQCLWVG
jgi:hypothetical protein